MTFNVKYNATELIERSRRKGTQKLTSCAMTNALTSNKPGRSTKDQLLDRVTNIRA